MKIDCVETLETHNDKSIQGKIQLWNYIDHRNDLSDAFLQNCSWISVFSVIGDYGLPFGEIFKKLPTVLSLLF